MLNLLISFVFFGALFFTLVYLNYVMVFIISASRGTPAELGLRTMLPFCAFWAFFFYLLL